MQGLKVDKAELGYVTSIDKQTKTFFAQFCKNSNEDLVTFNYNLNKYCKDIRKERKKGNKKVGVPTNIQVGQILCARFPADGQWYRARITGIVESSDSSTKHNVVYIDYGNKETLDLKDLIDPEDSSILAREPFGATCENYESLSDEGNKNFLDALQSKYVLMKMMEPQDNGIWRVLIPKHAYNAPFWREYSKLPPKQMETSKVPLNV